MLSIFFALISYLGWGVGDIFATIASRKIGGYSVVVWSHIFAGIMLALFIPFEVQQLQNITVTVALLSVAIVIIALIGDTSFNLGLQKGNASLVGVIAAAYPALSVIISTTFLKEDITLFQIAAIVIIFLGILMTTLNLKDLRQNAILSDPGVPFALITFISWGTYLALIKITVNQIGWFWPGYFIFLGFPLLLLFMKFRKIKIQKPTANHALLVLLLATVLTRVAEFSYNAALRAGGNVSIVSPISGSYPTLFVVLAFLIFKDKITRQQIAGIITTLMGIVLLSFFSV
ncbi:DMT family transporter [Candidatus Daviesbacteria bacterium]|nr:DMT family transporter [Candidatus Daviesbacteria bacterium]